MKLVDTSAWVGYLRRTGSQTGLRGEALVANAEAAWCEIIVLELVNCAQTTPLPRIQNLRKETWMFEIDWRVWEIAQRLAREARAKAITVPVSDLIIAACARSYDLEVEHHGDTHFDKHSEISIQ